MFVIIIFLIIHVAEAIIVEYMIILLIMCMHIPFFTSMFRNAVVLCLQSVGSFSLVRR